MPEVVIVGHGRSPEGKGWGPRIDAADIVVRMWDWTWQTPVDTGTKYDIGVIEISDSDLKRFWGHYRTEPKLGYIASFLRASSTRRPPKTRVVDQKCWTEEAHEMGGVGETGILEFTRGTIAACAMMEFGMLDTGDPIMGHGDTLILVGFDMVLAGMAFETDDAFAPSYQANPGSFPVTGWRGGSSKYGNHDFAIEKPYLLKVAERCGITLSFAQEIWTVPSSA